LWLHIDGAHGGAVVFSDKYKYLVDGIASADSVVIDTHKMMLTPALSTAVLFKKADDSYSAFKQKADYLFNKEERDPHNLAKRTYETTKYKMSVKVYYLLKMYGSELIESFINRQYDLARDIYQLVNESKSFAAAHEPMSNIFCFRYIGNNIDDKECDEINQQIRAELLAQGDYYIVSTLLRGKFYLRMTFMNPLTTIDHVINLLDSIKILGDRFAINSFSK
jgi:L-2,4-diaminobutyrate decarboxylase